MPNDTYDAIIIGSGQGGGPLSTALAAAGKRTALVEREHIGGTCINTGCTPTKTMIASAAAAQTARSASSFGVMVTGDITANMPAIRDRKRKMVEEFRSGSESAIRSGGVEIIFGTASFIEPRRLAVSTEGSTRTLTAPLIVIDTGGRPFIPPIPGLEATPYLDSTSAMELDTVPKHLIVLGGGYIGLEFAQMFRRFGSRVTIVHRDSLLLNREDPDVSEAIAGILQEDGIELVLNGTAKEASGESGKIGLTVEVGGAERLLEGSHLLVAVGRQPNVESLELRHAGIELDDHGFIKVDERLETTAPGVYAIGDCAGTPPFTHMSYDDFRVLRANLVEGGNRTTKDRFVPYTLFIDPQLGRVGLTEYEARKAGIPFKVAKMDMSHVARALESGNSRGFMKVLVHADTKQILGCAILGMEGGELMAMIEIAMLGELPYTVLQNAIFAHPTLAEAFNNLFGTLA